MSAAETCIIYNPAAGRGQTLRAVEKYRRAVGRAVAFQPTRGPGHGEELAFEAARAGFGRVVAAGGDGTAHEVANGLLRTEQNEIVFAVWPAGSANDYAHSLEYENSHPQKKGGIAPPVRRVDVGWVQSQTGRQRFFINGLGLGFNGMVTLESRRIRRLRGVPLYTLAFIRAMQSHFACPLMAITLDGRTEQIPTLALSISLGRREGNFVLAPNARLDDGLFDYLHAGTLRRWDLLCYLPRMITGLLPQDDPKVRVGRCRQARVTSASPLTIHLDGEFFSLPNDDLRDVEIRLLPSRLLVQTYRPET